MCITVITACESEYHPHAIYPRRSEEGIRSHGIEVKNGLNHHVDVGNCCVLCKSANPCLTLTFLTFELSPQPLTLFSEMGYYCVGQASLELTLIFCLRFPSAQIRGVYHKLWLVSCESIIM